MVATAEWWAAGPRCHVRWKMVVGQGWKWGREVDVVSGGGGYGWGASAVVVPPEQGEKVVAAGVKKEE